MFGYTTAAYSLDVLFVGPDNSLCARQASELFSLKHAYFPSVLPTLKLSTKTQRSIIHLLTD